MGSSSTLFKLESSLVSDIVAVIAPLLLEVFMPPLWWLLFGWLLLLFLLIGALDVISGEDEAESLDFLDSLLLELERDIYNN